MRGVTKPVTLKAEISDTIKNPWGQQVRGVKVRGALKRSEFGLKWNKALETGGVLVSDEVVLEIDLTLKKSVFGKSVLSTSCIVLSRLRRLGERLEE